MKTNILNMPIDTFTRQQSLEKLLSFLKEEKNHLLITPNPEIIMEANKDKELMEIIKNADLVVPDGIGVVLASKLNKNKIKERVAGYDLIQNLFDKIKDTNTTVYFFGAGKGVAELAKQKMEQKYKGLKIIGVSDGYFDDQKEKLIIENIQKLKPNILLIGLNFPKQEKWADQYKNILPVQLTCCIGGSFDGMSGTVKRAPVLFQKLGLEWFYRLMKQPKRIVRMVKLPVFVFEVLKEKITHILSAS